MALEIEKKFLLKPFNIKNLLNKYNLKYKKINISQYYIIDKNSFRVRKYGKKYFLTVKKGEGLVREEFEKEISKKEFEQILKNHKNILSLYKNRYIVKIDNFIYEFDIFKKDLKNLFLLEVEFKSEKEAENFKIDKLFENFILKDVTEDKRFTNFFLAKKRSIPPLKNCKNILDIKDLDSLCSTEDALKIIFHHFYRNILFHKNSFLKNKDPEDIHQLRVNLRKTRVFLKEFGEFFNDDYQNRFENEIKTFMKKTNKKRELDVLLINLKNYKKDLPKSMKNSIDEFKKIVKNLMNIEDEKVLNLLSDEFDEIDEIYKNLYLNDKIFNKKSDFAFVYTAFNIIKDKKKKIVNFSKKLHKKSKPKDFHKLRIEFKKFRYLLEIFSNFYEKKFISKPIKKLKKMQDILGNFQDIENQIDIIKNIMKEKNFKNEIVFSLEKICAVLEIKKDNTKKDFFQKREEIEKVFKKSIIF